MFSRRHLRALVVLLLLLLFISVTDSAGNAATTVERYVTVRQLVKTQLHDRECHNSNKSCNNNSKDRNRNVEEGLIRSVSLQSHEDAQILHFFIGNVATAAAANDCGGTGA